jgi:hypothetical protein
MATESWIVSTFQHLAVLRRYSGAVEQLLALLLERGELLRAGVRC